MYSNKNTKYNQAVVLYGQASTTNDCELMNSALSALESSLEFQNQNTKAMALHKAIKTFISNH